jgi:hypothetical protein
LEGLPVREDDIFEMITSKLRAEKAEPSEDPHASAALRSSRAGLLDAAAGVLAAMRALLEATEDHLRLRRDRLLDGTDGSTREPAPEPSSRHRIDLTY